MYRCSCDTCDRTKVANHYQTEKVVQKLSDFQFTASIRQAISAKTNTDPHPDVPSLRFMCIITQISAHLNKTPLHLRGVQISPIHLRDWFCLTNSPSKHTLHRRAPCQVSTVQFWILIQLLEWLMQLLRASECASEEFVIANLFTIPTHWTPVIIAEFTLQQR
jgi:hypothetical protein